MIIVVGNHKGGTSKSTLAVNLATEYQRLGHRVIILETDPTVSTASQWAADRENKDQPAMTTVRKTGRLGSTIDDLAAAYDVVIIDTAGKDSTELRSAAHRADSTQSHTLERRQADSRTNPKETYPSRCPSRRKRTNTYTHAPRTYATAGTKQSIKETGKAAKIPIRKRPEISINPTLIAGS